MRRFLTLLLIASLSLIACGGQQDRQTEEAGIARIAVATNFKPVMDELKARFEDETWFGVEITYGSTGALYTQILHGAPYDAFLAGDQARPERLEHDGQGVSGTRRTYALGQLVFWQPGIEAVSADKLTMPERGKIAIANPNLAPYGRAAQDALLAMGFEETLGKRLVLGENVGQAFAFIKTGNAKAGFVALSLVLSLPADERLSHMIVPDDLYAPIRQDAILLKRGADNEAAITFLAFLESDEAREIIATSGYKTP